MPWAVAGAVIGAVATTSASSKASKAQSKSTDAASQTQLAASRESNALQKEMYQQNRRDSAPWTNTGEGALNQLAWKMGITPTDTISGEKTREDYYNDLQGQYTSTVYDPAPQKKKKRGFGSHSLGLKLLSSLKGGKGGGGSRQVIDYAGLNAAADKAFAGRRVRTPYQGEQGDFGSLNRNFTLADRDADPVYQSGLQFGLDQGTQGIERQGAASGMQLSGATLKALARFGNDYGTTKAQGAYERFGMNQGNQFNRLSAIAGTGQQQVNQIGAAGQSMAGQVGANTMNAANNVANNTIGAGNARAGSYLYSANALNGAIGSGVNAWQQNRTLSNQNNMASGSGGYTAPNYGFGGQRLGNPG